MFFFQTDGIFDGYLRFNLLWFVIEVKFLPIMQGNIWFATTSSLVVFKFSSDAYIVLLDIDQLIIYFCHFIEIFSRNILVIGRKALPLHSLNKNQALQLGYELKQERYLKSLNQTEKQYRKRRSFNEFRRVKTSYPSF